LDLETAEAISAALTDIVRGLPKGVAKPTLAQQVSSGLLDVRHAGDHMVCHYDPAVGVPDDWDRALREELGESIAALVHYQPARTPPAELVDLFNTVVERAWHPRAAVTGIAAGVDWERELIVITLGTEPSDDVAKALRALVADRAVIEYGMPFSRR
jgi:hypothetical protein